VAVVAFDGVVLADLAGPCEVFERARTADGGMPYDVRVCSLERVVRTQHVCLDVPWRLATLRRAHTVIVPGIDDLNRTVPEPVLQAIRRAAARGARVASICTGAFVLAATGALDGRRATTHWATASELARRYPRVTIDAAVLYVDNGTVLTSAGAAAGLDLCIHLVRQDLGAAIAATVARAAVMPLERAGGQSQFVAHEDPADDDISLEPVLSWLNAHLEQDLSLERIAKKAGTSTRTLSRRFREQVGSTPSAWLKRARVRRAQRLLETTKLSIERVASEVGFGSPAVLREHFHAVVGTSPTDYRRSFQIV
jgi:transcriptional regulator GlxA family with amidase domain